MNTKTSATSAAPAADEHLPSWGTGTTAWERQDGDNVWRRFVERTYTHEGHNVTLAGCQTSSVPGEVHHVELSLDVDDIDGVVLEGSALIRGLATWLAAAVDALDAEGARP